MNRGVPSRPLTVGCPLWLHLAAWMGWGAIALGVQVSVLERTHQPWKLQSLVTDAGLTEASIYHLEFERRPESSRDGTVWLATSDGLREYDGYTWRRHGLGEGLPSEFVRCVLVTSTGDLWVGTDQGAGVYRRSSFERHGSDAGLAGPNVRRIAEDRDGTLWFCSDSWPSAGAGGGLTSYREGRWTTYRTSEGLPSDYVVAFHRDEAGHAWVATLSGIARWNGSRWEGSLLTPPGLSVNWGSANLVETTETGLVCSTGREMFFHRREGWVRQVPAPIHHEHGLVATADGRLLAAGKTAARRSAFMEWHSNAWVQVSADFRVPAGFLMDIREAPDGSVWAVGYNCLIRWPRRNAQWREFPGLPPPVIEDRSGTVWFRGDRRSMDGPAAPIGHRDGEWQAWDLSLDGFQHDAASGTLWGWSQHRVVRRHEGAETVFLPSDTAVATNVFASLDREGTFWLLGRSAEGETLVTSHDGSRWQPPARIAEFHEARCWRNAAPATQGVWFAADHGPRTDALLVHARPSGQRVIPVPKALIGLYHSQVHCDITGGLWLYGEGGLHRWREGPLGNWETITQVPARQVISCVERTGELWFLCGGVLGGLNGLARYSGGIWTQYSLPAVHCLALGRDQSILVGGDGWFYRLNAGQSEGLVAVKLPTDDSVDALLRDTQGRYWVAAGASVFQFRPDRIPPETTVYGPSSILAGSASTVRAEVIERFRPRGYRRDALVRWRLDGGDWSPARSDLVYGIPANLGPGRHRLEVAGIDAAEDADPTPATLAFEVFPMPVQNRAWFLPAVGGALGMLGLLTALAIHARVQLARYARELEQRVADRTTRLEADIERRRQSEEALRRSEQRFVTAFEASPIVEAISTYPEGSYIEVNQQFTATLGYTRDEVVGRKASDFGIWVRPEQRAAILDAIERGEPVRNHECLIRAKSGRELVFLTSVQRTELTGKAALLFASVDITGRKEMIDELLGSRQQLRALAARAEAIREEERTAISREVHDELGQMLSGLKMDLRWVSKRLDTPTASLDTASMKQKLAEAAKLADTTLATVQRIAVELRPGALDTLGLIDALRDEARRFERRYSIHVLLDLPQERSPRNPATDTVFFRIFQELLTNIARHAHASTVVVRLSESPELRILTVEDDGIGFDPEVHQRPNSLGLLGMSERAEAVGGRFQIERRRGAGTIARVLIPTSPEDASPRLPWLPNPA